MKWIAVILLVIVGVLAAIVAFEYFTVPIHALPSFIPGRHHGRGHYRKRGAEAALVAFVAFVVAGYLAYRVNRSQKLSTSSAASNDVSSDQLLSATPPATSGPQVEE
jgi:hypothetical protein